MTTTRHLYELRLIGRGGRIVARTLASCRNNAEAHEQARSLCDGHRVSSGCLAYVVRRAD